MLPLLLALVLQTVPAPTVVAPNAPYTLLWTHQGDPGVQFRLYIDGAVVHNYTSAELTKSATPDATGVYSYSAAGIPMAAPGSHTLILSAYVACSLNGSATLSECEAKSDPLNQLTAYTAAPAKPGGFVIKITIVVKPTGGDDPPTVEVTKIGGVA